MTRKEVLTILMIVVLLIVGLFGFLSFEKYALKKDVKELLVEQGYSEDDLVSLTAHSGKVPRLSVRVIFADEPNTIYYYTKNKNRVENKVYQVGFPTVLYGDSEKKHMDPSIK